MKSNQHWNVLPCQIFTSGFAKSFVFFFALALNVNSQLLNKRQQFLYIITKRINIIFLPDWSQTPLSAYKLIKFILLPNSKTKLVKKNLKTEICRKTRNSFNFPHAFNPRRGDAFVSSSKSLLSVYKVERLKRSVSWTINRNNVFASLK